MKKFKILATLAVAATMSLGGAIALTGCNKHEHSYTKWNYDTEGHHWKECPDDGVKDESTYGEHHFDGDTDTTCECGYVREVNTPDPETTGTVSGTVTAYGKALSGVKVTVGEKNTTTGSNGKFSLDGVTMESEVTVTFSKTGYINVEKKIATSAWTEKATTLDAVMRLTEEKATVSGVVKVGSKAMSGATVTLGDKTPVTTGADGKYSFEVDCSAAANLTLTVTHPYCENYSGTVAVAAGSTTVTKDVSLTSKTVSELGGKSLVELNSITASPASDYNFATSGKGNWAVNTDSYNMANEGLLLHEAGQDIASGSTELKLFAYKKLTFDGLQQVRVSATRFNDSGHNPNLQGGGYPEVYVLLVASDGTVIKPKEAPGKVEKTHSEFNNLVFTFDGVLTGNYVFAVGTTRGNRVAIESVKFRGEEVTGKITGTVKQLSGEALSGATVAFGQTTVITGSNGEFSIDVSVRKGDSDRITVSKGKLIFEIPFTASDLSGGTYAAGEFKPTDVPNLTLGDISAMTEETATSFNTDALSNWRKYGDVDKHGEGACLQANAKSPAHIAAKFAITDANKYMKLQARMFVRDSDQRGLLQVKVIKADGTVDTLAPIRVYHANEVLTDKVLNGNTLINDAEYYTEGVYDLSGYVGQTVVIAIVAVNDVEEITKNIHNAINDVTFKSNSDTEFGKPAVTQG